MNTLAGKQSSRQTSKRKRFWRFEDGKWPNLMAIAYIVCTQLLALLLLVTPFWLLNLLGSLLLSSSLVVAAYLIHELAHGLVFRDKNNNRLLGEFMLWLCGSAYASFERVKYMHLRHHGDRADITCFDYQEKVKQAPSWLVKLVYGLEWLHIPAVELVMHYQVLLGPFCRSHLRDQRSRVFFNLLTRSAFFLGLFLLNPWSLVYYAVGYLLFLKALYLGDAFAHTYEFYVVDKADETVPDGGRDAEYDRQNTYSNIVSRRFSWLNLYNLNFGYHNAHHDKPSTPWYRLPLVQETLYDEDALQYLPYREVWKSFHKNRLKCIFPEHEEGPGVGPGRADNFLGVHGVSFLSIV